MMTREEAEKELIAMLQEAEGGPSYSMGEVDAYMRELLHPKKPDLPDRRYARSV